MIKNVEQALFCLISPETDGDRFSNNCIRCDYGEMCGRVVVIIAEFKAIQERNKTEEGS